MDSEAATAKTGIYNIIGKIGGLATAMPDSVIVHQRMEMKHQKSQRRERNYQDHDKCEQLKQVLRPTRNYYSEQKINQMYLGHGKEKKLTTLARTNTHNTVSQLST